MVASSRGIGNVIIVVGGMMVALFVVISVMTGGGNVLGGFYRYLLPAGFIFGAVAPRYAFFAIILMCGYIDVLKKALAADYLLSFIDLFFILGIPSVTLLGICVNQVAGLVMGRIPFNNRNTRYLLVAVLLVGFFSVFSVARQGVSLAVLKQLANSASYLALIFVVPLLFPSREEVLKLLKFVVLAMIPAALHGLYHYFFGLLPFEERYMLSGLSINAFYVMQGEGVLGPFSAQGPLATTMATCVVLALFPLLVPKAARRGGPFLAIWLCLLLGLLFLAAGILSLKRGPLLIAPGFFLVYIILGRKPLVLLTYVVMPVALVLLVLNAKSIADRLPEWQSMIYRAVDLGENEEHLMRIRTLNVRLQEFSKLGMAENWAPFGSEKARDSMFLHAGIVGMFLKYGWVPFFGLIMCALPLLYQFHRRIFLMRGTFNGLMMRFGASMAIVLYGIPAIGLGSLTAFPNPFFTALALAIYANFGFFRGTKVSRAQPTRASPLVPGAPDWRPPALGTREGAQTG